MHLSFGKITNQVSRLDIRRPMAKVLLVIETQEQFIFAHRRTAAIVKIKWQGANALHSAIRNYTDLIRFGRTAKQVNLHCAFESDATRAKGLGATWSHKVVYRCKFSTTIHDSSDPFVVAVDAKHGAA